MMKPSPITSLFLSYLILLSGVSLAFPQMSRELKDFLWNQSFNTLITQYGEDIITLQDGGDAQKRLAARSYTEKSGLRIQTFAGSQLENANLMASGLKSLGLDSVYVVEENGLYKVQLGNFEDRLEAEKMLDRLRFDGISNAWIVQATIHSPKTDRIATDSPPQPVAPEKIPRFRFSIQLVVSSQYDRASEFSRQFSQQTSLPCRVITSGDNWKVVAGEFEDETSARVALEQVRSSGYPDAWLTQIEF